MTIASHPSTVTMPAAERPYPTILAFLVARFPQVAGETWQERLTNGKVLDDQGGPVGPHTNYAPGRRIRYFREREQEPRIPFTETILFHNDEILVACKPHFLPVIPAGPYINECLLHRLQQQTGNPELAPINRIDRETAGLVLFSVQKRNRGIYHDLFMHGRVEKGYIALGHYPRGQAKRHWLMENRIEQGTPWFRMQAVAGVQNARTLITLVEVLCSVPAGVGRGRGEYARFHLTPVTGKKHQLRLHMSGLGLGILHDRYYPDLEPERGDDFSKPLQLIAQTLRFRDPLTGRRMEFHSERQLLW